MARKYASLDELVSHAASRYREAATKAADNWNNMKEEMITKYNELPFGPTMKAHYAAGVRAATYRTDPDEYARKIRLKWSK